MNVHQNCASKLCIKTIGNQYECVTDILICLNFSFIIDSCYSTKHSLAYKFYNDNQMGTTNNNQCAMESVCLYNAECKQS